jgi:membrane fusion protein (multidrug efflux system)
MAEVQEQDPKIKGEEASKTRPEQLSYENAPAPPAKPPEDTRRKRKIRFIVLAVLVVAAIASIPIYSYYAARETTDDAQVDGHLVPISPRVSGTVLEVLVKDNEHVQAGQPLVKLDPADYEVALAQAQAQLATAQATTSESKVNVPLTNINTLSQVDTSKTQSDQARAAVNSAQQAANQAQANIVAAKATLEARQADYEKAQKDLARFKDLVAKDEISKQEYDGADAAARAGAANVAAAQANVTVAQRSFDKAMADLGEAKARLNTALVLERQDAQVRPRQQEVTAARYQQSQAEVQQRDADVKQAQLNLSYTDIKAPVEGVVSKKTAEPGMHLSAGEEIMALVPLDDVWITANFKETQLKKMRVGQKVEIEVDTFGGSRKYKGHIQSIAAASGSKFSLLPPENATGNYVKVVQRVPVKILLDQGENDDHRLLPGMSVTPVVLLNN